MRAIHVVMALTALQFTSIALAGPAPLPASVTRSVTAPKVTDGKVQLEESGFSMKGPDGWNIRHDVPGVSLVLEAPLTEKDKYRRTIQVRIANGARYLDSLGIEEFQQEISKKLGEDSALQEFSVRNAEVVKMDDGRETLLVYTGFKLNNTELMQAHILIPSDGKHAVITFTDVAGNFTSNAADTPLGIAWAAMTTAQLPGENPQRFAGPIQIAALAGVLTVLMAVLLTIRNALARQAYAKAGKSAKQVDGAVTGETTLNSNIEVSHEISSEDLLESSTPESIPPRRAA